MEVSIVSVDGIEIQAMSESPDSRRYFKFVRALRRLTLTGQKDRDVVELCDLHKFINQSLLYAMST